MCSALEPGGGAATVAGALLAVGGAYSAPGQGPFPAGGLIPVLKGLYDYSWVVGFAAGFLMYLALAPLAAARVPSGGAGARVIGAIGG